MKTKCLAVVLTMGLVFAMVACNAATVVGYVNLIVGIAAQIGVLAGLPESAATTITNDFTTVEGDFTQIAAANQAAGPGLVAKLDADLTVGEADLVNLEQIAGVKNPAQQALIQAAYGIAVVALNGLEALAAKDAPAPAAKVLLSHVSVRAVQAPVPTGKIPSPAQLKRQFNALPGLPETSKLK